MPLPKWSPHFIGVSGKQLLRKAEAIRTQSAHKPLDPLVLGIADLHDATGKELVRIGRFGTELERRKALDRIIAGTVF